MSVSCCGSNSCSNAGAIQVLIRATAVDPTAKTTKNNDNDKVNKDDIRDTFSVSNEAREALRLEQLALQAGK
ncbi:MAG: hypothetical protein HY286_12630 [Planctomycetes bacterium]|nr:hypothetical protein [Planctomycetota bacterium]